MEPAEGWAVDTLDPSIHPRAMKAIETMKWKSMTLALAMGVALALTGCRGGPEKNSGEDAYRHIATEAPVGSFIYDDFAGPEGDTTDWRQFQLEKPTEVILTVVLENEKAEASVGLYNTYGEPIAEDYKRAADSARLTVKGVAPKGTVFIKIAAGQTRYRSNYTMTVKLGKSMYVPPRPF